MNTTASLIGKLHRPERRRERARAFFPYAAAVLAVLALLSGNIHYREQIITLKEQHAAEIAQKERQIEALTPAPVWVCEDYTAPMDGLTIEHCHRTVTKL